MHLKPRLARLNAGIAVVVGRIHLVAVGVFAPHAQLVHLLLEYVRSLVAYQVVPAVIFKSKLASTLTEKPGR